MRVSDDMLRCVAFLGYNGTADAAHPEGRHLVGTGFFVRIPAPGLEGVSFQYLVTAKHVKDALEGNGWVRLNRRVADASYEDLSEVQWYTHPEHRHGNYIDVAVTPVNSSSADFDVANVPSRMILGTRESLKREEFGIGDDLFLVGLFASVAGTSRSSPIVRHGNLAMLPVDRIPTRDFGSVEAYLAEVRSFGGMSGCPVFIRETIQLDFTGLVANPRFVVGAGAWWLLGMMHGHWDLSEDEINAVQPDADGPSSRINRGIALVTPAFQIVETINQPALETIRIEQVAAWKARQSDQEPPSLAPQ